MKPCLAPSILSADLSRLGEQVDAAVRGGADWIHVDVMDGHFVPPLTFGSPIVRAVRNVTDALIDVHLMVEQPEQYLEEYAAAGANILTFHPEATIHVQRHLDTIRRLGMKAGLALNPGSPIGLIEELLDDVDLVLVMSVNPGFGGQAYIPAATGKIRRVRELLDRQDCSARLEVDGGITASTIRTACEAGADTFVAGTAVFGDPDPAKAVEALRLACAAQV